jgi:hypothetical protein
MRVSIASRGILGLGLGLAVLIFGAGRVAGQTPNWREPRLAQDPAGPLPEALNEIRPQVFVDGAGHVYRLWVDEWAGQGRHIRFQASPDGGRTWLPAPLTLDRDTPADGRSTAPAFAIDPAGGRLYAVWRLKLADGSKHIRLSSSSDRGAGWQPALTLNNQGAAFSGQIAAPGDGQVYVVWYDERRGRPAPALARRSERGLMIFFNRSADGGQTWLPQDVRLSTPGEERPDATPEDRDPAAPTAEAQAGDGARRGAFLSAQPRIQADAQGRVIVAWIDNREGRTEIYARSSSDGGRTWGAEVNVSRGGHSAREQEILTDGTGGVFLVWTDNRDGTPNVFFARSTDGGRSWDPPVSVSRGPRGQSIALAPSMALGPDGRLYVVWQDRRHGREDIYLNVSADGGKSWLDRDVRLDRDGAGTAISRAPQVVSGAPGEVAVVWEDDRAGFEQILLTRSADGGRTWLPAEVRVDVTTPPRMRARNPHAVWDRAGVLHVVWERWAGPDRDAEKRAEYRRVELQP